MFHSQATSVKSKFERVSDAYPVISSFHEELNNLADVHEFLRGECKRLIHRVVKRVVHQSEKSTRVQPVQHICFVIIIYLLIKF